MDILAGYKSSVFQDFESYLTIEVDLNEKDNRLLFDEHILNLTTYERNPGIHTSEDLSEVPPRGSQNGFEINHCNAECQNTLIGIFS